MAKLLNEWLFTGITASAALLSIFALDPVHPLAVAARTLGYGLAWTLRRRSAQVARDS